MPITKKEECQCPHCGGYEARIEDYSIYCDCLTLEFFCPTCGADWMEYSKLTYDGYSYKGKSYNAEGEEDE